MDPQKIDHIEHRCFDCTYVCRTVFCPSNFWYVNKVRGKRFKGCHVANSAPEKCSFMGLVKPWTVLKLYRILLVLPQPPKRPPFYVRSWLLIQPKCINTHTHLLFQSPRARTLKFSLFNLNFSRIEMFRLWLWSLRSVWLIPGFQHSFGHSMI
jgi:hypothetical protein